MVAIMEPDDGHIEDPNDVSTRDASTSLDQQVAACSADIFSLQRKQEQLIRRHEEAEEARQGQLQSVSERVYELERRLKRAEADKIDAIDKANAAFQKQHEEAQQDRQKYAHSIQQVSESFDRLYRQLEETRQGLAHTQENLDLVYDEMRHQKSGLAMLQQNVAAVEATIQTRHRDIDTIIACLGAHNVYTHGVPAEFEGDHLEPHKFMTIPRQPHRLAASMRRDQYAHGMNFDQAQREHLEAPSSSRRNTCPHRRVIRSARADNRDFDENARSRLSHLDFDAMGNSCRGRVH